MTVKSSSPSTNWFLHFRSKTKLGKNALLLVMPNKGRLYEPTLKTLSRAEIEIRHAERKYLCETSLPELKILLARAADIPTYVYHGAADLGITGLDMVYESQAELYELLDLKYVPCRLVLAVPTSSEIKALEDIKKGFRIATEYPNLTRGFFEPKGIQVDIITIHGAAEITPALGLADGITDLVATGSTLKANELREVATILESTTRLFSNKIAFRTKNNLIQRFVDRLKRGQRQ